MPDWTWTSTICTTDPWQRTNLILDDPYGVGGSLTTNGGVTWRQWMGTTVTQTATQTWAAWNLGTVFYGDQLTATRNEQAAMPFMRLPAEDANRQVAVVRARTMLDSVLRPEQKAELETHGRFHVRGSKGRRYCIRARGQSGNVELLDGNGVVQARLCAHPGGIGGQVPDPDAWLAQMLALEHDEDHFLRTANVHAGRLPAGVRWG